ncbi:MAG: hypothetical protein JNL67_05915 [Planctomycetaceae bacterium]|nr:hypothetical protein [Planctomycetaceae bacterium]
MMVRRSQRIRQGYSLVEMAVALPTIGILTVGMCSAVLLTVRAIPQDGSVITASVETARALEQLERDLRCALTVIKRDGKEIIFTVPDRNGDAQPETIRYWWSGVVGSPFLRRFNSSEDEIIVGQTEYLQLDYTIQPRVTNRLQETTTTSDPFLLASFESWPSITPTIKEFYVDSTDWIATTFELPTTVPKNYSRLRFTSVEVYGRRNLVSGQVRINVCRVNSSREPRTTLPLGTTTSISPSILPTSYTWIRTTLNNDVIATDGSRVFSIVFSGSTSFSPMRVRYLTSDTAPSNVHPTARWTDDSGGEWGPDASDLHKNDVMFRIFGVYETLKVEVIPETKQHIQSVRVQLRSNTNKSINIDTTIGLLNLPEATQINAPSAN